MLTIDDIGWDAPWNRSAWTGELVSGDGTDTTDFARDDVARVLAFGETAPHDWDGNSAAILELKDGRFVSWESWWDATGSGFCCDAYGGTADICFSSSEEAALAHISEKCRELLKWNDVEVDNL